MAVCFLDIDGINQFSFNFIRPVAYSCCFCCEFSMFTYSIINRKNKRNSIDFCVC